MIRHLTVALAVLSLLGPAADAHAASVRLTHKEANAVTKQALLNVADLIDATTVKVRSCEVRGNRARCHAVVQGTRQRLEADVAIREVPDDYVVRVLHIG
jgi:hypothetical protein